MAIEVQLPPPGSPPGARGARGAKVADSEDFRVTTVTGWLILGLDFSKMLIAAGGHPFAWKKGKLKKDIAKAKELIAGAGDVDPAYMRGLAFCRLNDLYQAAVLAKETSVALAVQKEINYLAAEQSGVPGEGKNTGGWTPPK